MTRCTLILGKLLIYVGYKPARVLITPEVKRDKKSDGEGGLSNNNNNNNKKIRKLCSATLTSKSVTIFHKVVNKFLVSWNILSGPQIGRTEDLGVFGDFDVRSGTDPWLPSTVRQLKSCHMTNEKV
jgi:hypothetical protein